MPRSLKVPRRLQARRRSPRPESPKMRARLLWRRLRRSSCRPSPQPKSSARVNVAKTDNARACRFRERAAAARPGRACRQAGQDAQAEARRRRGRDAGRRRNRHDAEIRNRAGGRRMGGSARGRALRVRGAGHPLPAAEQIQRRSGLGLARRAQGRSQRRDRLSRPGRRPFQSRCAQLVHQAEGERRRLLRGEKQLTQGLRA